MSNQDRTEGLNVVERMRLYLLHRRSIHPELLGDRLESLLKGWARGVRST